MGADIVDVNMGCPVPKIAKHHAGCSLMREPAHAASIIGAMVKAVKIPVTVKMRAGWNEQQINAPDLARRVEDVGASAVAVHGRTAAQSYTGESDWTLIERIAGDLTIPVFGSGDCVEAPQVVSRLAGQVSGVLIGRGALRNPWIFAQAASARSGAGVAPVPAAARGEFLLEYIDLLLSDVETERSGFRHVAPGQTSAAMPKEGPARSRERWVVNKLRALGSWYTKGLHGGSDLRVQINSAESVDHLRDIIRRFFFLTTPASDPAPTPDLQSTHS
jgi:tRNA-dihydrouridine synthase B